MSSTRTNPKLIVCYMVEKDMDVFPISAKSVQDVADHFIIVDGNATPRSDWMSYTGDVPTDIINSRYPVKDKGADGIQRGVYLKALLDRHEGDWCLVLDADEVLSGDGDSLKQMLLDCPYDVLDVHMRHFIGDFGHEDATQDTHLVPRRLFKIKKGLYYPPHEHSVLSHPDDLTHGSVTGGTIWHINTARGVLRTMKKYLNNLHKSPVHTRQFLNEWYHAHALGLYPTKQVRWEEIPEVIRKGYCFNEDFLYFQGRNNIETKHFVDAGHWRDYFSPKSVLEIGCGLAPRVAAMKVCGIDAHGIELSQYAVDNSLAPENVKQGDILIGGTWGYHDLVIAYDVLEHIDEEYLPHALDTIKQCSNKHVLLSIPFEGDANLYADSTHKIFKPKEWWVEQIEFAGLKVVDTPEHFLYKHQLIVCEVSK